MGMQQLLGERERERERYRELKRGNVENNEAVLEEAAEENEQAVFEGTERKREREGTKKWMREYLQS